MSQIEGKVVLITGASSGIGEATARVLSRKGASVVLGTRRTERLKTLAEEIRKDGGRAEYRTLDVTKLEGVQAFVKFGLETYGRIDVIVNNAGVATTKYLRNCLPRILSTTPHNRAVSAQIATERGTSTKSYEQPSPIFAPKSIGKFRTAIA
jgi:NADP-dependent 3-hydroxy acid dehydrogenase YdfG